MITLFVFFGSYLKIVVFQSMYVFILKIVKNTQQSIEGVFHEPGPNIIKLFLA